MFVSLRIGVLVRLLVAVAAAVGVLVLALTAAAPAPRDTEVGTAVTATQGPRSASDRVGVDYRVRGTGSAGLNVRACPAVDCAKIGRIEEGATFRATCRRRGTAVGGEVTWLRGTVDGRHGFASGHYLRANTTRGVPPCTEHGDGVDAVT